MKFNQLTITGKEPAWCVDGRAPKEAVAKGPQMLGGSLHPIVLKAIFYNKPLNAGILTEGFDILRNAGFGLGVHTDEHAHGDAVGCGFAQNLPAVFEKAQTEKDEITKRLQSVYEKNKEEFGGMDFAGIISSAFEKLLSYSSNNLQLIGKSLVEEAQYQGADKTILEGEHGEQAAYVNLRKGTSYNTAEQANAGKQAFNLDLWAVVEQTRKFGLSDDFIIGASLILYQATEMVLVESGRHARGSLQVLVHA
jgi:hypothetical protein